jgi:2-polyprenyl-3-methyl-5-hydroxy-6-metoxy-1,4-benzoquinol methylase
MRNFKEKDIDKRYYDEHLIFKSFQSVFQKYRVSKVLEIYKPNKSERVLDLGCGRGTFCFAVAPLCKEVIGIDFSRKRIELGNTLLAKTPYTILGLSVEMRKIQA